MPDHPPPEARLRRSVLYMPGSNRRALEKAKTLAADGLILDLEDAVAATEKEAARTEVCRAVREGGYGARERVIRINAPNTPGGDADLHAAAQAGADAILVPKVSTAALLAEVAGRLDACGAPDTLAVWAMIETPAAILNAYDIAMAGRTACPRLRCLVLGLNDLAKETLTTLAPGRAAMLPWMMSALAAARAEGLAILDGVWNDIGDADGFVRECEQARHLGFDGKTLIHPTQVAAANAAFTPSEEEVRRARSVLAAFAEPGNAGHAALKVEGRLYEREHLGLARRTVSRAEAIAARRPA